MVEEAGAEEEPVAVHGVQPAVDHHLGTGVATALHVRRHPIAVRSGDERAHLDAFLVAWTNLYRFCFFL